MHLRYFLIFVRNTEDDEVVLHFQNFYQQKNLQNININTLKTFQISTYLSKVIYFQINYSKNMSEIYTE